METPSTKIVVDESLRVKTLEEAKDYDFLVVPNDYDDYGYIVVAEEDDYLRELLRHTPVYRLPPVEVAFSDGAMPFEEAAKETGMAYRVRTPIPAVGFRFGRTAYVRQSNCNGFEATLPTSKVDGWWRPLRFEDLTDCFKD